MNNPLLQRIYGGRMQADYQLKQETADAKVKSYSIISSCMKALIGTGLIIGIMTGVFYISSGGEAIFPIRSNDKLSSSQAQERTLKLRDLGALNLSLVSENEIPQAVESMNIPPKELQEFLKDHLSWYQFSKNAQKTESTQTAPVLANANMKLAWITLWDTNAEDGDIVRIESQGYFRTVVLKNQPITFSVPVPESGIINIMGVNDGDGYGITLGVGSKTSKIEFPVMNDQQTLGLSVKAL